MRGAQQDSDAGSGMDDGGDYRTVRHGDIPPPYNSGECFMHV